MTARRDRSWLFALAFALIALTIYVGEACLARSRVFAAHRSVLAPAIAADLALFVPLLWYLMVLRPARRRPSLVLPAFLIGVTFAAVILPADWKAVTGWLGLLAASLEVVAIAALALRLRRALRERSGGNVEEQTRSMVAGVLGDNLAARIVAAEFLALYYGLFAWRRPTPTGPGRFATHEKSGWGGVAYGLGLASLFEAVAVHFLVARWSVPAAWLLTFSSIYGALWLVADYQAARLNPVTRDGDTLVITCGLRGRARIPLSQVEEVRRVLSHPDRKVPGYASLVLCGAPQVRLHLSAPVTVDGPFGLRRQARYVAVAVDDPEGFVKAVSLSPASPAP